MKKYFLFFFCIIFLSQLTTFAADEKTIFDKIDILKAKDIEHKAKWKAKIDLVKIGKDAVSPLIEALKEEGAKYYAIRALGEISDERAVEPLAKILLDKNYGPRRYAAIALGRIKSAKAIPALKEALNDARHVNTDVLIALEQIDAPQARKIISEMQVKEEPNGLEIEISAADSKGGIYKEGDSLKVKVVFGNISSSDYYIQYSGIYKAIFLRVKDESGKTVRPLRISEYGYVTSEADFHIVKAGQAFTVELEGKIKTSPPAAISRSTSMIDWWDVIYPKGPFKTIDFGDMALDVGILDYKNLKIYFVFEQGETDKYWGGKFGYDNIWIGRAVSNSIEITVE